MTIVSIVGTILVAVGSLVVINRYFSFKLHKNTYPVTLSLLSLNMMILLSTTYLLPLDLYYSATSGSSYEDPVSNSTVLLQRSTESLTKLLHTKLDAVQHNYRIIWLIIYWLEFVLCWITIPILISYVSLKYYASRVEVKERIKKAIFQNIKFYLISAVGIIIGIIYLIATTGHAIGDLKSLLISLAHLYSLSYMLLLLSSGLILLPSHLLSQGRLPTEESNNRLFVELSKTNDDMNDSQLVMNENATIILQTPELNNGDVTFNDVLSNCKIEVQSLLAELKITNPNSVLHSQANIVTLDKLNSVYNKFITQYYNFLYYREHSNSIIHTLAHANSPSVSNLKRLVIIFFGIICMFLSILVFFLELIPIRWAHGWLFFGSRWYNFSLQFIILSYNTLVSLYAMSKFKFSNFHLIPNGRSNPSNALYYSLYSSRLLFPICFNLMSLIPTNNDTIASKSSFETTLYYDLKIIPLVNMLNRYAPIVFMILVPISYQYDLKQKVLLRVLGEEYYYQFFGMMLYEPVSSPSEGTSDPLSSNNENRRRMDEDYAYSLQDGRYLFERASSNYNMFDRS
ncbi:hypothetical protein Kpol_1028p36 [Vanderwaltozyma polyspora DSM 70294]|uniref:Uncharacterized protein n=1 Tax=Vanderwaltozyma polyspora (strain ATCC 22028 / DSM 70294 / BCRC 21397 / CBS 2163 / NBRC 10782 / NRRL Y-8283 / UCD 57-17) TaxID=436907 RepID=A7TG06_VANPO|nr:uncharacterized protein Kpol_1028p36 [Vanderwaltozyma polyspora DSM 70294]EDO18763.1 hypothetical protein Kpol_1028p36 [Vanderwaltozyma polyspora DSM 70294]